MPSTCTSEDPQIQPSRLADYNPLDAPEARPRDPNSKRRTVRIQTQYDGKARFIDGFVQGNGDGATLTAAPEVWEALGEHYTPVSDALLYTSPLKPGPKLLLITLLSYLRAGGPNTSYPGAPTLAKQMNISENTVHNWKATLEDPGDANGAYLIWETGGWNPVERRNETNSYHVTGRYVEEHKAYVAAQARRRGPCTEPKYLGTVPQRLGYKETE